VGQRRGLGRAELDDAVHRTPQRVADQRQRTHVGADAAVGESALERGDHHGVHAIAGEHAAALVAGGGVGIEGVGLEACQRVEAHRRFAREGDVGAAAGLDLGEAGGEPGRGSLEAAAQLVECPLADREQQVGLVLEVDVQQRARQPCPPGDQVHRHRVEANVGRHGLGGVEDVAAALRLLFLAAIGEFVHGCG
jgi:hypothetical protein